MGRVVYLMNMSLDGFVEAPGHDLSWGVGDDEVLAWFVEQTRAAGAFVYGRGLYETMGSYWPTALENPPPTEAGREFARLWNAMPKLVCSSTLETVSWNSRLVRGDIVDEIGAIRDGVEGDIHVGGPTLAAALVRRNLVDEYRLVVHPVAIGTGTPYLPTLEAPLRLRPTRTWAFEASGVRAYAYEPVRE